jgi:copper chaperone NosL
VTTRAIGLGVACALVAVIAGVVLLWPGPGSGPEPIRWGRDTCAGCRMPLDRPGFAGEMRDHDGTLTKYDDVGCLLRAIFAAHREVPEAWVEDHDGGGFVPLVAAHLVRAAGAGTPMGFDIVAFEGEASARAYAAAHAGEVLGLEDVLRRPTLLARRPEPAGAAREGTP